MNPVVGKFVQTVLKPRAVIEQPNGQKYNSAVDVIARWRGRSAYIITSYRVGTLGDEPGDTFEAPLARITAAARNRVSLSYMRHAGRWIELGSDLRIDECIETVRDDELFTG